MPLNKYNGDVVNTRVSQDELSLLQAELFAAAREALAAARSEGKIPSSLITSCHQIVRDAGMKPDVEGLASGDDPSEIAVRAAGFDPNWLRNAADVVEELDQQS
jgi:hypothetical protein